MFFFSFTQLVWSKSKFKSVIAACRCCRAAGHAESCLSVGGGRCHRNPNTVDEDEKCITIKIITSYVELAQLKVFSKTAACHNLSSYYLGTVFLHSNSQLKSGTWLEVNANIEAQPWRYLLTNTSRIFTAIQIFILCT